MASESEFVGHVIGLMAGLGDVRARAMFGGYCIYLRQTAFAIVVADRLYFRTDSVTRPGYEGRDAEPFSYVNRGKTVAIPYHEAPADALESPESMRSYALEAIAASLRAAGERKRRRRKRPGRTVR